VWNSLELKRDKSNILNHTSAEELKQVPNKTSSPNLEKNEREQLNRAALDLAKMKQALENYPVSDSVEEELSEFIREVARLQGKGKNFEETIAELIIGSKKYVEAVNTPIVFEEDGVPKDIINYSEKLQKLSEGIESCWDIFSPESHQYFVAVANGFCEADSKFRGLEGILLGLKLLFPSILQKKNLFKIYRDSSLAIPRAVTRAMELRKGKTTIQLEASAKSILSQIEAEYSKHNQSDKTRGFSNSNESTESLDDLIELIDDWSCQEYPKEETEAFERVMERLKRE
jgi:hypothetical protein